MQAGVPLPSPSGSHGSASPTKWRQRDLRRVVKRTKRNSFRFISNSTTQLFQSFNLSRSDRSTLTPSLIRAVITTLPQNQERLSLDTGTSVLRPRAVSPPLRLANRLTYQFTSVRTLHGSKGIRPSSRTNMISMANPSSISISSVQLTPACFKPYGQNSSNSLISLVFVHDALCSLQGMQFVALNVEL